MKFCLNGELTIGTLEDADIEIRKEIGAENFFCSALR
ncbi:MAG: glycogen/starch/alpha-glucan phosphorylase [Methylomicrobium sp.]